MSATDDDEGKFGEITYSIDSPSAAKETFKIDNNGEYDNNLICTKKRTSCSKSAAGLISGCVRIAASCRTGLMQVNCEDILSTSL